VRQAAEALGPGDLPGDGPLHARIRAAIARRIATRAWPPGARLPREAELAAALGTSRMTVRRALDRLVQDGLILRKRRFGTVVAEPSDVSAPLTIRRIRDEVTALGLAYSFRILERAVRPGPGAIATGGRLLEIVCLHSGDATPVMHERRWISLAAVPAAEQADFAAEPPGEWLLREVPWTLAEHRIRAVPAEPAIAAALAIPPLAPCLEIERATWNGPAQITLVRLTWPGSRKVLVGRFGPGEAG
jgi:GntR family histidine utilization transcriptional repressor